jgi:hypothetical protein
MVTKFSLYTVIGNINTGKSKGIPKKYFPSIGAVCARAKARRLDFFQLASSPVMGWQVCGQGMH